MTDNFDYRLESINVDDLLPVNIRTDITTSTFSTGINRLLTPEDTIRVYGTVGTNKRNSPNIEEDSIHRNTYQLQPLITSNIATESHISSFKDILNKLKQLGVDINKQDKWLDCDQFNFAPPIDVDKFVHFNDYYWTENSDPEYIIVNNPITRINSLIFEANLNKIDTTELVAQKTNLEQFHNSKLNQDVIDHKYMWIDSNKWVHKSELSVHKYARPAKVPILEFFDNLEVNEWTYTKQNWMYRKSKTDVWSKTDKAPSDAELNDRFPILKLFGNTAVVLGSVYDIKSFTILESLDNNGIHNVTHIQKLSTTNVDLPNIQMSFDNVTDISIITIDGNFVDEKLQQFNEFTSNDLIGSTGLFNGVLVPFTKSSLGDDWQGLFNHWSWVSKNTTTAINHQPPNEFQQQFFHVIGEPGYDVSRYFGGTSTIDGELDYGYDGQSRITLPINYILDSDDLQVYVNGIRQYTNYIEAISIDNNSRYDNEPYSTSLYDMPLRPKSVLSNAINFTEQLNAGDKVIIKVGPSCAYDVNRYGKYVLNYNTNTIEFKNLMEYRLHEQPKIKSNQYLKFDIYNINKQTAYTANEIFMYKDDISANINKYTKTKTATINNSFVFNNLLVSTDGLYCYKEYLPYENITTVWKKSNTRYIPKQINRYRETATIDSDWELPDPFTHNVAHECQNELTYGELYSHFDGITQHQVSDKPYIGGNKICKTLSQYNYVGGNIKEHNNNLDMLCSSMHQDVISITSLIDFAKNEYNKNLYNLRKTCFEQLIPLFSTYSNKNNNDFLTTVIDYIISNFTNNAKLDDVYYDTTCLLDGTGVANWITTLPILGLYPSFEPSILKDDKLGINKLRHHDGHLSDISITSDEFSSFINILHANGLLGETTPLAAKGKLWFNNGKLLRCYADFIQTSEPIGEIGQTWFEPNTNKVYKFTTMWVESNDIIWSSFEISTIINNVLLIIENKLYERAKKEPLKLNFTNYIGTEVDQFIINMSDMFSKYIGSHDNLVFSGFYDASNAFTWNYFNIASPSNNVTITQEPTKWGTHWYSIYEQQYGTAYPHLEPWKLQGYKNKPINWDNLYRNGSWTTTMWFNIRNGIIPEGLEPPIGLPKTYNIISVNDTGVKVGLYEPNDLLPPYVSLTTYPSLNNNVLVIFNGAIPSSIDTDINKPTFGKQGFIERKWMESIDYPYDLMKVMFKLQPVRFIRDSFGSNLTKINGLLVDKNTNKVPSYKDTVFHGTVKDNNRYLVNGINQWYINALRSESNTISMSEFIELWTKWEPKLTYQTNSVIDYSSLLIDHPSYDLKPYDYSVTMKKSFGSDEKWLHSLKVSVFKINSSKKTSSGVTIPTSDDWQFRIDTLSPTGTNLKLYNVSKYNIKNVDVVNNTFELNRIETDVLGNKTSINCLISWQDNTNVFLNYTSPMYRSNTAYQIIKKDTKFGLMYYDTITQQSYELALYDTLKCYTVGISDDIGNYRYVNSLQLCTNKEWNATLGVFETTWVDVNVKQNDLMYDLSTGKLTQYKALSNTWFYDNDWFTLPVVHNNIYFLNHGVILPAYNYTIDGTKVKLNFNPTDLEVRIAIKEESGLAEKIDPFIAMNGKNSSDTWYHTQIDKANGIKSVTTPYITNGVQDVIDFIDGYSEYLRDQGFIFNDYERTRMEGSLLVSWQTDIEKFIDWVYYGVSTTINTSTSIYDYVEINPFKYELWLKTPYGIVSDILSGPFRDISLYPIVYDQNGRPITSVENLKIIRTDKESHFTFTESNTIPDPINAKYIGGMHIFIDYFEHIVQFNNYSTMNYLLFSSFLGINTDNLLVQFNKHYETTKRPNISGGFLIDNRIVDNIEQNTVIFNELYDTYADESNKHIINSRNLVGYNQQPYLGLLDSKSRFLFWKGMIHYKGTVKGVQALVNNANLNSLILDEYWSYKLADFGHTDTLVENYLKILFKDVKNNRLQYQLNNKNIDQFISIDPNDPARWLNLPDIKSHNIFEYVPTTTYKITFNSEGKSSTTGIDLTSDYYPYVQTDICDSHSITVDLNLDTFLEIKYIELPIEVPFYIMNCDMVNVYANGIKQHINELDNTHIQLPKLIQNTKINIIYKTSTLKQNIHYNIERNNIIKFNENFKISKVDYINITINNIYYNVVSFKLIDTNNDIVDTELPIYHPAYRIYNDKIKQAIINDKDPANYDIGRWDINEVGKKWVDNGHLRYLPYYDKSIYSIQDQVNTWGTPTDWSFVNCYEWIESDIQPKDNPNAYTVLQKSDRSSVNEPFGDWFDEFNMYQVEYAYQYINDIVDGVWNIELFLNINPTKDSFGVYLNELPVASSYDSYEFKITTITLNNITDKDVVRIVRFKDSPTIDQINADTTDLLVRYQYKYPYNVVYSYSNNGISKQAKYYYWVRNTQDRNPLSTGDIERLFVDQSTPHVCVLDVDTIVIKNVENLISNNNYALLMIKDTKVNTDQYVSNTHNRNAEWQLVRKNSLNKIPVELWNKITESIIGETLAGVEVPSYSRLLQDRTNKTNTRYGLQDSQVLGERDVILNSLLDLLYSNDFFMSFNKDLFFDRYLFDTTTNIKTTMMYLYKKMTQVEVNTIFFHILNEAMARSNKIDGIFKTSMVVLDGDFNVTELN